MPPAAADEIRRNWGPLHTVPRTAFPRPRQEDCVPCTPAQRLFSVSQCCANGEIIPGRFRGSQKSSNLFPTPPQKKERGAAGGPPPRPPTSFPFLPLRRLGAFAVTYTG